MKKTRFQAMQEQVAKGFPEEQGKRIIAQMEKEYNQLCSDLDGKNDPMDHHKRNNIFPVVTAFHAFINEGMTREEAAKRANDDFLVLMEDIAGSIRKMLKFPGLYKLIPKLFNKLMPKLFSPESGFAFKIYDAGKGRARFDMTKCPYMQACVDLDCIELAPTFCNTDDTCYGNMHPKLMWNRTKTLAKGGDVCDFDLYIKK